MPRHKIHPPRHPAGYANFAASRTSGRKNRSQSLSDARDKRSLRLSSLRFALEKHAFFLLRLCRFTAQSAFVLGVLPARAPCSRYRRKNPQNSSKVHGRCKRPAFSVREWFLRSFHSELPARRSTLETTDSRFMGSNRNRSAGFCCNRTWRTGRSGKTAQVSGKFSDYTTCTVVMPAAVRGSFRIQPYQTAFPQNSGAVSGFCRFLTEIVFGGIRRLV